jgi:hypothetical protein
LLARHAGELLSRLAPQPRDFRDIGRFECGLSA